jgi:hypothetical protein
MARRGQDRGADALLDLDGQVFAVDPKGEYVARFVARRVEPSPERPHGLNYSLTLHGPDGRRLLGFDNAHAVRESRRPGGAAKDACDHRHRMDRVRPYRFRDAVTLVEDFWAEVDRFLKEKGVV